MLLYVEDEFLIQETVIASLEEAGFELLVAESGEQAVQLLTTHAAHLRGLITDVNLGDGLDGWVVAREARRLVAGLPVVYVSGASEHEWTSEGVPGSTIIAKPFACTQLVVAISALLVISDH
ncbi:response regulator [Sphingomonas caeni]|uniref:response regulator n=1 Tax=Sphingomonas caeni TaxID=2984949 RepID=UPI002231B302|nr:response regulator [Sphingomonas caeni]